jgi:hypothetical protein
VQRCRRTDGVRPRGEPPPATTAVPHRSRPPHSSPDRCPVTAVVTGSRRPAP